MSKFGDLALKGWDLLQWEIDHGRLPTDADLADAFDHGPPPAGMCAYIQGVLRKEIDRRGRRPQRSRVTEVSYANYLIERTARWRRVFAVRYKNTDPTTAAHRKIATEQGWSNVEVARKRVGDAKRLAAPWLVALLDEKF